jgi:glucose/arabinose dehydrogenase/mono/diheme cytochrome c family protein
MFGKAIVLAAACSVAGATLFFFSPKNFSFNEASSKVNLIQETFSLRSPNQNVQTTHGSTTSLWGNSITTNSTSTSRPYSDTSSNGWRVDTVTVLNKRNVPWELVWGPDQQLWFTEQSGQISRWNPQTGICKEMANIGEVHRYRSAGLLGMALHPNFPQEPYVYVDYTALVGKEIVSHLVRFTYIPDQDTLLSPLKLLENIPGSTGHNGARIVFGKDGKLYLSTGEKVIARLAQDKTSINGKILRINPDGSIPSDNPIPSNPMWSYGHRNIQGLTVHPQGFILSAEHGDAVSDEINRIQPGENYGWPLVEGFADQDDEIRIAKVMNIQFPAKDWTPCIAPSGIEFFPSVSVEGTPHPWSNSVIMATLKAQSIRILHWDSTFKKVIQEEVFAKGVFGRLRDICIAPTGDIYVSTSNRDWNKAEGFPLAGDDRIIRIRLQKKSGVPLVKFLEKEEKSVSTASTLDQPKRQAPPTGDKSGGKQNTTPVVVNNKPKATSAVVYPGSAEMAKGKKIYDSYCASCHKSDGTGIASVFPPLKGAAVVRGVPSALLKVLIEGMNGPITRQGKSYNQQMPGFKFLPNEDLAAVANYIRNSFGNKSPLISPAEVAAAKNKKKASTP